MIREPGDGAAKSTVATEPQSLARRIGGWSTNLFACGLIAIFGLVVGRQMLAWWTTEQVVFASGHQHQPDVPRLQITESTNLAFGSSSAQMRRWQVVGDIGEVLGELRSACRAASESSAPSRPPTAAEARLIAQIIGLSPCEQHPGKCRLFELAKPLPMVVAISDRPQHGDSNSTQIVSAQNGVLSWGLAFPGMTGNGEGNEWTLLLFVPATERQSPADNQFSQVQTRSSVSIPAENLSISSAQGIILPDSCQRLIAMPSGKQSLIGFASAHETNELAKDWDATLIANGWQASEPWQVIGSSWHRRYVGLTAMLDVQFAKAASEESLGFASVSPRDRP